MKSPTALKYLLAVLLVPATSFSFAGDDHGSSHGGSQQTIEDDFVSDVVAPIIETNCLGCHNNENAAGGHSFQTIVEIKSHAKLIFDAVANSRMPKNKPEWRHTIDAKILMFWAVKENSDGHDH